MKHRFFLCLLLAICFMSAEAAELTHIRIHWADGTTSDRALCTSGLLFTLANDSITLWKNYRPATVLPISDVRKCTFTDSPSITITALGEHGTIEGAGSYAYGDVIMLTAHPEEGYLFEKWTDGDTSNPRTINVIEDDTYTAIFAKDPDSVDLDNVLLEDSVQKVLENGQLIIIKNGVRYSVLGARL